ncbi:hypothetical protein FSARC_11219 [Fusarium sarcochroum]|uniref:Uncharacterized protein n=1 Tax=Fusarium sarcochroum TaxID=1208366 RepID=A0A8H4X0J1_9HYPO|nr:hypothetical protein FSARC_11219 [Fusarium sarcochroum]
MPKRRNSEDHPYRDAPHIRNGDSQPVSTQQILPTWDRDYTVAQVHEIDGKLDHLVLQRDDFVQTLSSPDQEEMDWYMSKHSTAGLKNRTKSDNDLIHKLRAEKRSIREKLKTATKKIENFNKEIEGLKKDCDRWYTRFRYREQMGLFATSASNNMLTDAAGEEAIASSQK